MKNSLNHKTTVKKKISFLGEKSKEEFILRLQQLLQGKVTAAYVFGSFFSEDFHADSDLDLLIIAPTKRPFIERSRDYTFLFDLLCEFDVLVYTPQEFTHLQAEFAAGRQTGFWKTVFSQLKKIV